MSKPDSLYAKTQSFSCQIVFCRKQDGKLCTGQIIKGIKRSPEADIDAINVNVLVLSVIC